MQSHVRHEPIVDPGRACRAGLAYAALDLGTTNCRLLVACPVPGGFRVLESFNRIVRLGEGLQQSGALSEAAMQRALEALSVCATRLSRHPLAGRRAIATEACRRAANGAPFLDRVRAQTGLAVDIITPREEAALAVESCASLLAGGEPRALLFDIGGGSTELAWVRTGSDQGGGKSGPELIGYASLPVGVVTLAERFGAAAHTAAGFAAMVADVAVRLQPFEQVHCIAREIRQGAVRLLGTSGTVTTLAGLALGLDRYRRPLIDGVVLRREAADLALAQLRAMDRAGLADHPCIGPDRADFVLPGCAIYAAIIGLWPASRIVVADRGLREGMLLRMMRDPRPARLA